MSELALPGDQLGFSEEFVAGANAFEKDGVIYAATVGVKKEDSASRSVGVVGKPLMRLVKPGDVVYGMVDGLMDTVAIVRFQAIPPQGELPVSGSDSAYLRVSELAQGYVENIRDCLRVGDVIRAKIIEVKPLGIYLTLKSSDLGVVRAFCSRCRTQMSPRDNLFACPRCGSKENRKAVQE